MVFTLYGAAGSGSAPVEATLRLIGLDYRVVEAPTWEGEAERDKVAAVNPMRQIPVLVTPGGEVITENAAILIWLADAHPQARLSPGLEDPRRAQFLRWMSRARKLGRGAKEKARRTGPLIFLGYGESASRALPRP